MRGRDASNSYTFLLAPSRRTWASEGTNSVCPSLPLWGDVVALVERSFASCVLPKVGHGLRPGRGVAHFARSPAPLAFDLEAQNEPPSQALE